VRNKATLGLATALALAVTAVAPAGAQAETVPRWFIGWGAVGTAGASVGIRARAAKLTFHLMGGGVTATCRVVDQETVVDPHEAAGIGEVTSVALSKCTPPDSRCGSAKLDVLALGLPWGTHLAISGGSIRDVWEGVQLDFRCAGGADLGAFMGTLSPVVNDHAALAKCSCCHPRDCAQLEFEHEELSGLAGGLGVSGVDKIQGIGSPRAVEVKRITY
jgi:hypothetical protein